MTIEGGAANYAAVTTVSDTAGSITNWGAGWSNGTLLTLTTSGNATYSVGQWLQVAGSKNGQTLTGIVNAINGKDVTLYLTSFGGAGTSTGERIVGLTGVAAAKSSCRRPPTPPLSPSTGRSPSAPARS